MESAAAGPRHLSWPEEVLAQVLQHVPQQQRLSSCALVSCSWLHAAITATTSVDVSKADDISAPAISKWLLSYGNNLHSLKVSVARTRDENSWAFEELATLLLPFLQLRQLRHLDLQQLVVQQRRSNGFWRELASLTSLRLHEVHLQTEGLYAALSSLTNLCNLQVTRQLSHLGANSFITTQPVKIDLAPLSRLTRLAIDNLHEDNMAALGGLQLLELRLGRQQPEPCTFQHLPLTLTRLEVCDNYIRSRDMLSVSAAITPRVMELTSLKDLRLTAYMGLEPLILSSLVKLTHLELHHVKLVPAYNSGTRALLGILPCLVELCHLSLPGTLDWRVGLGDTLGPEVFSALLSSTGLTCLDISECILPCSIVQHMFPSQPSALRIFRIQPQTVEHGHPIRSQGELQHMVQCCPLLEELCLVHATRYNVRLTTLGQLSDLTSLKIGGRGLLSSDHDALEDIVSSRSQLSKLVELTLCSINNLAMMNLLCLRQLTQLTRLNFSGSDYANEEIGHIKLSSKAEPPDVWLQFEEACLRNGIGVDVLLQERFAGFKDAIASLQQQLGKEQQSRVSQEQRATRLEQQVQDLEQQLREEQKLRLALQRKVPATPCSGASRHD